MNEFQSLIIDVLGKNYDLSKLEAVEDLHVVIANQQTKLLAQLNKGTLTAEQYVDQFNDALAETFANIKHVLGADDFQRLFGGPSQLGGCIDKETFLREYNAIPNKHSGKSSR